MNNKSIASLIYFADGIEKERVEKWIKKLMDEGHVVSHDTREYDPVFGDPVWYIP